MKGVQLDRIRVYYTTWQDWAVEHPHTTVVLSAEEVRNRHHGAMSNFAGKHIFNQTLWARISKGAPRNPRRKLLIAYELVFGLLPSGDSPAQAYQLDYLRKSDAPLQLRHGDVPLLLFVASEYQVGAYVRKLGDHELEFSVRSTGPFALTDQRGNIWNRWGRTLSGPDHPAELPVANGYMTKWYEWLENYPDTNLVSNKRR